MITPMRGRDIDTDELARLVAGFRELEYGGVLAAGTTGEGPLLTDQQYSQTVRTAVQSANGQMCVIAGASETSAVRALRTIEVAAKAEADAVLVLLPYYFRSGNVDVVAYFSEIARESPLPIVVYNFPRIVGQAVTAHEISELLQSKKIVGIKDSSGTLTPFNHLIAACGGSDFKVMQGLATLAYPSLCMGASGFFSATSNVVPELDKGIYRAFLNDEHELCRDLQRAQIALAQAIAKFGAPVGIGVKRVLHVLERGSADTMYPAVQAKEEAKPDLDRALKRVRELVASDFEGSTARGK
jgi:dihydrodipicolinate synthase/N-acetylneuraminate lyase